jgi:hypothetical protein
MYQTLMRGTETAPETSVIFNRLALLIAREDFIRVYCWASYCTISIQMTFTICFCKIHVSIILPYKFMSHKKTLPLKFSKYNLNSLMWLFKYVW